jgi:glycosyltransferase involved in cell wall biosynthesis
LRPAEAGKHAANRFQRATAEGRRNERLSEAQRDIEQLYEALRRAHIDGLNLQEALRLKDAVAPKPAYARWLESRTLWPRDFERLRTLSRALTYRPKFSIVVATYDTAEAHLRAALDSVLAQTYDNWELCVADDASPQPQVRRILQEYAARDARVRLTFRAENGHISRATNSALEIADGDFVCLLDHDDLFTPDALFEMALLLNIHPDADFIYSDEDKLDDATGQFVDPYFKPDWCPDSFLSRMYTAHLGVYRRSLVQELGGMREGFEGSQDYDLVLRLVERTHRIHHIPKVLYHWRIHAKSTASEMEAKPYAVQAGQRAIAEAIERRGQPGGVLALSDCPGTYIIRYQIGYGGRVMICVSAGSGAASLERCLQSIFSNWHYADFEVVVLADSADPRTLETCRRLAADEPRIKLPEHYSRTNPARLRNDVIRNSGASYVLFMDDYTEVITPDWITAFVEQAQRPTIGAVGPLIIGADGNVRQAGLIIGTDQIVASGHRSFPRDAFGYFSTLRSINNFSAFSGACMMVRRETYLRVGGLDEQLALDYGDIDLCLRLRRAGYDNVFLPHVVVIEHQQLDEPNRPIPQAGPDFDLMRARWRTYEVEDPCYNPNLAMDSETYGLRV